MQTEETESQKKKLKKKKRCSAALPPSHDNHPTDVQSSGTFFIYYAKVLISVATIQRQDEGLNVEIAGSV